MSEPITLYKDGETVTLFAPSVALDLQAMGWTTEPEADDVPFDFVPAEDDTQEADIVPVKAKRGRPRKAK